MSATRDKNFGRARVPTAQGIRAHMRFTSDDRHLTDRASARELVRISRGCYLESAHVLGYPHPWERHQIITFARIISAARTVENVTAAGRAASLLHGLPCTTALFDIDLVIPATKRGRRVNFPPVTLDGQSIAPACRVALRALQPVGQKTLISGVRVLGLSDTIISAQLLTPGEASFVVACEGIKQIARFSRRSLDQSRAREEVARSRLLEKLRATPPRTRNRRLAEWALMHADAACDSVAEERLLHLLHSAGIRGLRTQHLVAHQTGKYYLDFAVPEQMLGIEFDGRGKYGADIVTQYEAMHDQVRREEALEQLGWTILRFVWTDLEHPDRIMERIDQARPGLSRRRVCPETPANPHSR